MTGIDSFDYWMQQLESRSLSTRRVYSSYFTKFCEYVDLSPNQLIETQRQALASRGDPRENHQIENQVRAFMNSMKESHSASTRRQVLASVKSFFDLNLHPLRLSVLDRPRGDSLGSRTPEKEEVVMIADAGKWKYRAAIMFLKDSGLRVSDVVRLKWKEKVSMGGGFWNFSLITQKRAVQACAFVGPETTRLLEQFKTKTGRIFRTGAENFDVMVNLQIKRAGVEGVTAHGLRKYFVTSLEHARVPKDQIWHMCGKKSSVYSEKRRSELFKSYRDAYFELSVYYQREQQEEVDSLRRELAEIKRKLENPKLIAMLQE